MVKVEEEQHTLHCHRKPCYQGSLHQLRRYRRESILCSTLFLHLDQDFLDHLDIYIHLAERMPGGLQVPGFRCCNFGLECTGHISLLSNQLGIGRKLPI